MIKMLCGRLGVLLILLSSCSSVKTSESLQKQVGSLEANFQNHTGFVLYDVAKDKIVYSHNGDKYFTPASNTKIFTMFATLKTQGDFLPGLLYSRNMDTLFIRGTGDPSFLYEPLPKSPVFDFLSKEGSPIVLISENPTFEKYGPGWSWDDYNYTYSVERSLFPVYGNAFTFHLDSISGLLRTPQEFFKRYVMLGDSLENPRMIRDEDTNRTTFFPPKERQEAIFDIPFKYSDGIFARLLTDTLKQKVLPLRRETSTLQWDTLYSIPTDSAIQVMMKVSDNFIAEQLMIMNGMLLTDSLDTNSAIRASIKTYFEGMPDDPIWVDGSGLSRYNLFTPRSIVWLWKNLLDTYGRKKLFPLLATGGEEGTLQNYYVNTPPFLFGKTGTLSNNNSLSGFLVSQKGKVYIFSMMHNNYPTYSTPVKREMERILTDIYENN